MEDHERDHHQQEDGGFLLPISHHEFIIDGKMFPPNV